MRRFSSSLALGLALVSSPTIAGPTATANSPATSDIVVTAEDRADFRAQITSNPLLILIMETFPADYAVFETSLLRDAKAGSIDFEAARKRTGVFIAAIEARLTPFTGQAPDADLVELLNMHVDIMAYFQGVNLRACYEMGEGDGLTEETIATLPGDAVTRMQSYSARELRAGMKGQTTRVEREEASEADIAKIVETYEGFGGDLSWLAAMGEGSTAQLPPGDRCANALLWMRAVAAQPAAIVGQIMASE